MEEKTINERTLSNQRRRRIERVSKGLCDICGKPRNGATAHRCSLCQEKKNARKRQARIYARESGILTTRPIAVATRGMTDAERFWFYVDFSGAAAGSSCWEWAGGKNNHGYGSFWRESGTLTAQRASWELNRGPIPDGLWVLHKCDNRSCVRPDHLFLGTNEDNVKDRQSKGRTASGDRNGSRRRRLAKLCAATGRVDGKGT